MLMGIGLMWFYISKADEFSDLLQRVQRHCLYYVVLDDTFPASVFFGNKVYFDLIMLCLCRLCCVYVDFNHQTILYMCELCDIIYVQGVSKTIMHFSIGDIFVNPGETAKRSVIITQ